MEKNYFVDLIWSKLMNLKNSPDPIHMDEEEQLKNTIQDYLYKGWNPSEIVACLRWTEYFDTETPENVCLDKMNNMEKKVAFRLSNPV